MARTVNKAALDLIVEFEGLRTSAYPDPAHGWAVPTVGVGHTTAAGKPAVYIGMKITEAEAYDILDRDLAEFAEHVSRAVKVPMNDNQFGALVSFTFNLGMGNLNRSTLLKKLNAGDYEGAAEEFGKWNRGNGKVMKGLTRRRAAEAALFRSGATTPADPQKPASDAPIAKGDRWGALVALILDFIVKLFIRK